MFTGGTIWILTHGRVQKMIGLGQTWIPKHTGILYCADGIEPDLQDGTLGERNATDQCNAVWL